ncbi:MAG: hypothetical protein HC764_23035 [Pleurocapsa sp. CRU_1_2]|nr:hypothetical protein [Pleurocapsa sp. CRU_1_2]
MGAYLTASPLVKTAQKALLFCVHPIGGGVSCYRSLAQFLSPELSLYGFQAYGLEDGTYPIDDIPSIARLYIDELLEIAPDVPIHIAGWSLGGLIAFEMARQLQAEGFAVGLLALFDSYAPVPNAYPYASDDDEGLLRALIGDIATLEGNYEVSKLLNTLDLSAIPLTQRKSFIFDQIIQSKILGKEADYEQLQRRFDVIAAHQKAASRYIPKISDLELVLFRAEDQSRVPKCSNALGWDQLPVGNVEIEDIPGNHRSMLVQKQSIKQLSILIKNRLY